MKTICQRLLPVAVIFATALPLLAGTPKTEDVLFADLSSPKPKVVINALQDLEKYYPTDPKILPPVKGLLTDARPEVKRKAARVLGTINAEVTGAELKSIATLLDSTDKYTIIDGLKALRGLKAQSTIPQITPLLQHTDLNVKRDAIRTLAVLGDKSLVPAIQPLLTYPDLAVQKDAADAIAILKEK